MAFHQPKETGEELHDCQKDPQNLINLASSPKHKNSQPASKQTGSTPQGK